MTFDFKKVDKKFYMPKKKPEILTVPPMKYIAVRGQEIPINRREAISRRLEFYMRWLTR